jgi:tetratricopeptide (TPR) repeat protein
LQLGEYQEAARHFQRSLALAEAEFDNAAAVAAASGLGDVGLALGEWAGAHAWYQRAMRVAEAATDPLALGRLRHRLGRLEHERGDFTGAGEQIRAAREQLEPLGDAGELAAVLNTQGLVDAAVGRPGAALAAYREALAWAQRVPKPDLELEIRLNLADLALGGGRLLDAEEELRRAEEAAIAHHLVGRLVRVYGLMGRLRGLHGDETGFVFFEQAVALCRTLASSRADEAWVHREYGLFRLRLGQPDEARAYLERAQELFGALGRTLEVARVREELERLSA